MEALSDIVKGSQTAFAPGGAGSALSAVVTVNFGAEGQRVVTAQFTVTGATTGMKVASAPSLSMPSGLLADELEMEMFTTAAVVLSANTVLVTAVSLSAPISGQRNINLILV